MNNNLIHQSTKEFLLSENQYSIFSEDVNRLMFRSCCRYLTAKEFKQGCMLIHRDKDGILRKTPPWEIDHETHYFPRYALSEWLAHAFAGATVLMTGEFEFDKAVLEKVPTLRDTWLLRASEEG